jgi:hypothetical protein
VHYPGCVFHQATGLWCPGCGLTRGCYELLHGNVAAALSSNIFTPLALVLMAGAWVAWLRWSWTGRTVHASVAVQRAAMIWLPVVVLFYGVLRNIPATPFRSLAP